MSTERPAGFRWLPGMLTDGGRNIVAVNDDMLTYSRDRGPRGGVEHGLCRADEVSPGWCGQTCGVLLDEVRRVYAAPFAQVSPSIVVAGVPASEIGKCREWAVYLNDRDDRRVSYGPTEHEALCAALAEVSNG